MGGWSELRSRLKGDLDGNPMLFVFSTCRELVRTMPMMLHDPNHPEDLDTDLEDHLVDALRYLVMSRAYRQREPDPAISRSCISSPAPSSWTNSRIDAMPMQLLDLWEEIGRMREVAEQRQRDAVTAGNVLAALAIGQLIGKIAGLDWDIRVAEVRIFDERDGPGSRS